MAEVNTAEIFSEINTPLRFYDSEMKRNEYRYQCKNVCDYKLLALPNTLLPFMIVRDYQICGMDEFLIVSADGSSSISLSISLLEKKTLGTKDYIIYNGDDIGQDIPCGFYYAQVTSCERTFYSEKFYITPYAYCGNIAKNPLFRLSLADWGAFGEVDWDTYSLYFTGLGAGGVEQFFPINTKVKVTIKFYYQDTPGTLSLFIGSDLTVVTPANFTDQVFYGDVGVSGAVSLTSIGVFAGRIREFTVEAVTKNSTDCNIGIEWGSECDFGDVYYGGGFRNRFYFPHDAALGEPKYKIETTGIEDGFSDIIQTSFKREKVYRVELGLTPEHVVDALIDMQGHPIKRIYLANCLGWGDMKNVEVTPTWVFAGCYATVIIEFTLGKILETACCDELSTCVEPCAEVISEYDVEDPPEGKILLDKAQERLIKYINGTPVLYPCSSGYITRDPDDSALCPAGWFYENGSWQEMPRIISSQLFDSKYLVKAVLMAGSKGSLEISCDAGDTWTPIGYELNAEDFKNIGQYITVPSDACLIRVICYNNECGYGSSCPFPACQITCTSASTSANGDYTRFISRVNFSIYKKYSVTISSIEIDGVETLADPVIFEINSTNVYFGYDGLYKLRMLNVSDMINSLLPTGYSYEEDGRICRRPCGHTMLITGNVLYTFIDNSTEANDYQVDLTGSGEFILNSFTLGSYDCN